MTKERACQEVGVRWRRRPNPQSVNDEDSMHWGWPAVCQSGGSTCPAGTRQKYYSEGYLRSGMTSNRPNLRAFWSPSVRVEWWSLVTSISEIHESLRIRFPYILMQRGGIYALGKKTFWPFSFSDDFLYRITCTPSVHKYMTPLIFLKKTSTIRFI